MESHTLDISVYVLSFNVADNGKARRLANCDRASYDLCVRAHRSRHSSCFLARGSALGRGAADRRSRSAEGTGTRRHSLRIRRVYADAQGRSHFEEVEVDFPAAEFVPGMPVIGLSPAHAATGVAFARVPPDWDGGRHPTPRRQFGAILAGGLDLRTSDGEVHRFTPGGVFLLDDTTGEGHHTSTMGGTEATVLLVWLDAPP